MGSKIDDTISKIRILGLRVVGHNDWAVAYQDKDKLKFIHNEFGRVHPMAFDYIAIEKHFLICMNGDMDREPEHFIFIKSNFDSLFPSSQRYYAHSGAKDGAELLVVKQHGNSSLTLVINDIGKSIQLNTGRFSVNCNLVDGYYAIQSYLSSRKDINGNIVPHTYAILDRDLNIIKKRRSYNDE